MLKSNIYFVIIITIAATCGLLFGFDTSIVAGASPFIQQEFYATDFQLEMVVSSCILGALFGALLSGYITDKFGRKWILIITGLIFIIGTIIAASAITVIMLMMGRFILGFAVGIGSFAAPLFIAEIAPAKSRGKLVLWNVAFITGGQVVAFLVNYMFTAHGNWRLMILTGIIPAIVLTIGMLFMSESPKWLAYKGHSKRALAILSQLCGDEIQAQRELEQINIIINQQPVRFKEIFAKSLRPVLIIGLFMGIGQQFMGINTVMYYGPYIMKHIGFSDSMTQIFGTLGLGLTNFLFTIITLLFIDRIGRRKFLLIGSLIASLSLFAMIVFLANNASSAITAYLALLCLVLYVIGYCISLGALFWLLIAEIFPLHVRGTCMSFVVAIQWGANFIVASTFLTILNTLGMPLAFGMYGFVALVVCIFTYFKIPETKGVTLETIETNLKRGLPSRRLGADIY